VAATIALLNMKGGVGKTTLAVNLAWHFHSNEGQNVLLVDLDPQFNATQYVMDFDDFQKQRKNAGTIYDLLIDPPQLNLRLKKVKANPKLALHTLREENGKRLDLLPSELDLAWVVKNPAQMGFRLEKLLKQFRSEYDYIFVDCAPTDSILTTMALTASDYVLIPMRPDRFSILGFANLNETVKTFRKNSPDPRNVKILGIVFTQVTGASNVETQSMDAIESAAQKEKTYLFKSSLKYSQSFVRSVKDQTPIFETWYAHRSTRRGPVQIAEELKERIVSLTPVVAGPGSKKA
jgi:chromosome partitioning protein